jgi:DNA polymerase IIIc chi subunit
MRKLLLAGIAALFLATGTAHAEEKLDDSWWTDCRHGWITKEFKAELMQDDPPVEITDTSVRITYDELRKLLKDLPRITRALKACDAYRKCLDDRDAGKVKHCYANDRRWREFFTHAW